MNLKETLKTLIYSPKHTQNTKMHVIFFKMFKKHRNLYFQKKINKWNVRFNAALYGIIYILCWGPHSLTNLNDFYIVFLTMFIDFGSKMGPGNSGRHPPFSIQGALKALPKRIRDATSICHRFGKPFELYFNDFGVRFGWFGKHSDDTLMISASIFA